MPYYVVRCECEARQDSIVCHVDAFLHRVIHAQDKLTWQPIRQEQNDAFGRHVEASFARLAQSKPEPDGGNEVSGKNEEVTPIEGEDLGGHGGLVDVVQGDKPNFSATSSSLQGFRVP